MSSNARVCATGKRDINLLVSSVYLEHSYSHYNYILQLQLLVINNKHDHNGCFQERHYLQHTCCHRFGRRDLVMGRDMSMICGVSLTVRRLMWSFRKATISDPWECRFERGMELARCSLILDKGKEGVGSSWSLLGHGFLFSFLVSFNMAECDTLECLVCVDSVCFWTFASCLSVKLCINE
jgi:hypothetical protein